MTPSEPGPRPEDRRRRALGAAVRTVRDERGMRQLDLAEATDLTVWHLSRIETGKVNPTWETVGAVADALGTTIAEIAVRAERIDPTDRGPRRTYAARRRSSGGRA